MYLFVFFFKQKTAYEMRISDWSSDVCSSDLEPQGIHVEEKVLIKALSTGHFMNTVVMIDVGGSSVRTLPKDVQFHPVSDRPLHADFLRISEHATIHVNIPVRFVDEDTSPGIKRGGVLNIVRHDLDLVVDADRKSTRLNSSH